VAARWSREADVLLARLYQEGAPLRAMSERLGRSEDAIVARRRALAIARRDGAWSAKHDALIVAAARAGLPASAVSAALGIRADRVRRRRAKLVGARAAPSRYRAADDAEIARVFGGGGDLAALSERLGRSPEALRLRARALGVSAAPSRRRWTPAEDDALRAGYRNGCSCQQIAERIGGARSAAAVAARARKLGLSTYGRSWSIGDDERLRALLQTGITLDAVALTLVRSPDAVRQRARRLAVAMPPSTVRGRTGKPWTADEDAVLRAHAAANPILLASALGRSANAVRARMRALALTERRQRSPHDRVPRPGELSPGERAVLSRELLADPEPARMLTVARRLRRPPAAIRSHLEELRQPHAA
jgi:hypothetical protein